MRRLIAGGHDRWVERLFLRKILRTAEPHGPDHRETGARAGNDAEQKREIGPLLGDHELLARWSFGHR